MILRILGFIWNHPLNRGAKFAGVLRFLRFQIATRVFNYESIVPWVNDTKFIVSRGQSGISGNLYCGLMEPNDMCFLMHYLNQSDQFYDIGANVGAYTLLASGVRKCRSYAFEPVPRTYHKLTEQVRLNDLGQLVTTLNCGVADKPGELSFTTELDCQNRVSRAQTSDSQLVPVVTLDSLEVEARSSVVKIDVEGYEWFVLQGGEQFFARSTVGVVIIELNGSGAEFGVQDSAIHDCLARLGFFPVSYDPFSRAVTLLEEHNTSGNTIYVKDFDQVQSKVRRGERVMIHTSLDLLL